MKHLIFILLFLSASMQQPKKQHSFIFLERIASKPFNGIFLFGWKKKQ